LKASIIESLTGIIGINESLTGISNLKAILYALAMLQLDY
jgi:hypothetical protein